MALVAGKARHSLDHYRLGFPVNFADVVSPAVAALLFVALNTTHSRSLSGLDQRRSSYQHALLDSCVPSPALICHSTWFSAGTKPILQIFHRRTIGRVLPLFSTARDIPSGRHALSEAVAPVFRNRVLLVRLTFWTLCPSEDVFLPDGQGSSDHSWCSRIVVLIR